MSYINPVIAHKVICANTSRLVSSNIDPFLLARDLFSNNVITEECYRTVTDRHCGMTTAQRLEYVIHTIRGYVKTKPAVFSHFNNALTNLGDTVAVTLAEEMRSAYKVQEAVDLQGSVHLKDHMIQSMVDDAIEKIYKWQDTRRSTIDKLNDLANTNANYWKISLLGFGMAIALVGSLTIMMSTLLPLILVCTISTIVRAAAGVFNARVNLVEAHNYVDLEKNDKREVVNNLQKLNEIGMMTNLTISINFKELLEVFTNVQPTSKHSPVDTAVNAIYIIGEFLPCGTDPIIRLSQQLCNELDIVSKILKKDQ